MVYNIYLYSLEIKLVSQEQKLGIINWIPQKDKDLCYLKNWWPVRLLNLNYKILAKPTPYTKLFQNYNKPRPGGLYNRLFHFRKCKIIWHIIFNILKKWNWDNISPNRFWKGFWIHRMAFPISKHWNLLILETNSLPGLKCYTQTYHPPLVTMDIIQNTSN